jgi:hypothetical protein
MLLEAHGLAHDNAILLDTLDLDRAFPGVTLVVQHEKEKEARLKLLEFPPS